MPTDAIWLWQFTQSRDRWGRGAGVGAEFGIGIGSGEGGSDPPVPVGGVPGATRVPHWVQNALSAASGLPQRAQPDDAMREPMSRAS